MKHRPRQSAALLALLFAAAAIAPAPAAAVDPPPGRPLARLPGPTGTDVAFSRDEKLILTAGGDQARVWDADTYKLVTEPLRHKDGQKLFLASLSPDGKLVLTAADKEAWVWDVAKGECLSVLRHEGKVRAASFSPDGSRVLTAADDRFARVWDADTGAELLARKHPAAVYRLEISADGRTVLTVAALHPGQGARQVPDPEFPEWQYKSAVAYVWDARTGRSLIHPETVDTPVGRLGDLPDQVAEASWLRPAALSPDGTKLAVSRVPDGTTVWDIEKQEPITHAPVSDRAKRGVPFTGAISHVLFTPDSRRLLTVGPEGRPRLWLAARRSPADGAPPNKTVDDLSVLPEPPQDWWPLTAAFSPDGGRVLFTSGGVVAAYVVGAASPSLTIEPSDTSEDFPAVAFSPDGRRLAAGFASDGFTGIWQVEPAPPAALDAEAARAALIDALENPPAGQRRHDWFLTDRALPKLKTDEVVDRDGVVWIGGWRINLKRKTFSLTRGRPDGGFFVQYTGTFRREPGRGWTASFRTTTRGHN